MTSNNKKILVVFGATGVQGGSVAKAILGDPVASREFHVRAVTRNPSKPAAVALADAGAEVVNADLGDKETLRLAMKDAYAVFSVTNFLEGMDPVVETRQGKNVADIAKELDIKHLVWSSLPNVSKITNNKLTRVVHFDSKARVADYIKSLSIPHTIVHVGAYSNLIVDSLAPISAGSKTYGSFWSKPANTKTALPVIDASADVGKFIKAILLNPAKSLGRQLNLAERMYTLEELLHIMRGLGLDVILQAVEPDTYKKDLSLKGFPEIFQEDIIQVSQFVEEYDLFGGGGIEEAHELLNEPLATFQEALKSNPDFLKLIK